MLYFLGADVYCSLLAILPKAMDLSTASARLGLYIGTGVAVGILILIAVTLHCMFSSDERLAPPAVITTPSCPTEYPYTLVSTTIPPREVASFWGADTSI